MCKRRRHVRFLISISRRRRIHLFFSCFFGSALLLSWSGQGERECNTQCQAVSLQLRVHFFLRSHLRKWQLLGLQVAGGWLERSAFEHIPEVIGVSLQQRGGNNVQRSCCCRKVSISL